MVGLSRLSWSLGCAASAAIVMASLLGSSATAAPIITLSNYELLPQTAGQTIQVFVSGSGDSVDTVNFSVATGDGGTAVGGTANSAPTITNLTLNGAGMLFAGQVQSNSDTTPQYYGAFANRTPAVSITSSTLLAQLTISTVGFTGGTYPLVLDFTAQSGLPDTNFALGGNEIAATIQNGTITVTPEPAALSLIAVGAGLTMRRRGRA